MWIRRSRPSRALVLSGLLVSAALLIGAGEAAAMPLGSITEYPTPTTNSGPANVAAGPEGDIWFTEEEKNRIGRITPAGVVTEFPLPNPESEPSGITIGPEGNMWFTEYAGNRIGRITPSGSITEFPLATAQSGPRSITLGPEGVLWFTENGGPKNQEKGETIGRMSPAGTIVGETKTLTAESGPFGITTGPDGNIWFTEPGKGNIGRITPGGAITEFNVGGGPRGIAPGPNGEVWFTESWGDKIGHLPTTGLPISEITLNANSHPYDIALGADGALWFTEDAQLPIIEGGKEVGQYEVSRIGRITQSGASPTITEYPTSALESRPAGIAPGPEGNVWFTESTRNNIGVIGTGEPEPALAAPTVSGNHEAGSVQTCSGSWSSMASLQPSASLFGMDGYAWLLNGAPIPGAVGPTYTPSAAQITEQLSCSETVTYPLLLVTASAASAAVVVIPPPPVLTGARESHAKWRAGHALARLSARGVRKPGRAGKHRHSKPKAPVGTTLSFTLSEPAAVVLGFTDRVPGRAVAHKCVTKTHGNRKHRLCTRTVSVGALALTGHAGMNKVAFDGRLSAAKALTIGSYTVTITASNSTGASAPASLGFAIVK